MQSTLAERLREALDGPSKLTSSALARACNIKPPSVSAIVPYVFARAVQQARRWASST